MSAASSTVPHRPSTSPLPCRAVLVRWIGLAWSGESCCAAGLCSTYVRMFVHTYIHTYIQCILPCLALPRLALSPRTRAVHFTHLRPHPRGMRDAGLVGFARTPYNIIQAAYPAPLYHVVYLLLMLLLLLLLLLPLLPLLLLLRRRLYQTGICIRNRT
jgi:hypothetical protein